ncbi:hypothetical protein DICPUDRAFT_73789, partial [Dictyostelium purpureum]
EKEIQELYQLLSTELKETDIRVKEDVVDRSKKEEKQMKKMKDELLNQFYEMEKQLKEKIDQLNQLLLKQSELNEQQKSDHKDDKEKSNTLSKSNETPTISNENKEPTPPSDSELTIDESPEKENKSKEEKDEKDGKDEKDEKDKKDKKEENMETTTTSSITTDKDSMKLKITFTKKPVEKENNKEIENIELLIKQKKEEVVRKIEEIKKAMNDKIMNFSVNLATQGREFDRLVSLESNEYEKHLAKKFSDMKKELNENTDALATSFDIIDNILVNQAQQYQHHQQQKQSFNPYNQQQQQPFNHYNQQQQQPYYSHQSKSQQNKQNYLI